MITRQEISIAMVSSRFVLRGERPALLTLVARLLAPEDRVRSRLRAARASLDEAVARLESPASTRPGLFT